MLDAIAKCRIQGAHVHLSLPESTAMRGGCYQPRGCSGRFVSCVCVLRRSGGLCERPGHCSSMPSKPPHEDTMVDIVLRQAEQLLNRVESSDEMKKVCHSIRLPASLTHANMFAEAPGRAQLESARCRQRGVRRQPGAHDPAGEHRDPPVQARSGLRYGFGSVCHDQSIQHDSASFCLY